ncbi:MAG: 4Fe-4S binding protein [Elusimicrobiota bacterium]|nr:4Fe-4S binding protein [Elusimicrobiota bacterium]
MTSRQKIRKAIILISFLLFPVTINYFSPYIIIDGASKGIVAGSFITFALLFFVSLFLGRSFCGWLCPAGGVQEWCFAVNDKKARDGRLNCIKYFIWIPWIGIIIITAISAGGFHTVNPLHLTETGISVSEPASYMLYFTIVGLFLILSFTAGKRAFCHYLCWMAPFMIIGTKIKNFLRWPSLHLEVASDKCKQCKTCDKNCPMSLEVSKMVERGFMKNAECILCGNCVDNCTERVIKYHWRHKKTPSA